MKDWQAVAIIFLLAFVLFFLLMNQLTIAEDKMGYCEQFGFRMGEKEAMKAELTALQLQDKNNNEHCTKTIIEDQLRYWAVLAEKDKNIAILKSFLDLKDYCVKAKQFALENGKSVKVVIE